jgi:tRNA (cytidine/uridine-2'-O-)-methyltransferase
MFNVVLIEPEIPPNTGNVGRLCLATRSTLHLVKPLGFSLDDRQLKRAGLDYWDDVDLRTWNSFDELQRAQPAEARYFFLTTKTDRAYYDMKFRRGDFLVFGRETKGLPESLLTDKIDNPEMIGAREPFRSCITIPMHGVRSLNLATAVAIVLFEAVRQQNQAN